MIILLLPIASAITTTQETSSVSRIVGESPREMIAQLERDEISLNHVSFYKDVYEDPLDYKEYILRKQFPDENNIPIFNWGFTTIENNFPNFLKNELFILETDGDVNPLLAKNNYDYYGIYPPDLKSWQTTFKEKNPLTFWDSPYAGAYLPKHDSFVARIVRDSTILAPTSFNSPQFTKSFLCNLLDKKTIGEVFIDARNFHYNGGSTTDKDNMIGLVLQSYALYGNPRQEINMDWDEDDLEEIKKYCENNHENLAPDIEFLGYVGNYSKFRKYVTFEIESFNIIDLGNYSILNASPAYNNYEYDELVIPIAVRTTRFPTNTIITNYSIDYIGDYEDLTIEDLPSYEFELLNRTCYYDNESYKIELSNSYTGESQDVIATIHPVEIINCTEGWFRLYKTFNYSIDYISLSPILITNIGSPISLPTEIIVNITISTIQLTTDPVEGSIAVFDSSNNKLWEEETYTNKTKFNALFHTNNEEGIQKYSVEFLRSNNTVTYNEFFLNTEILEVKADIPISVPENPILDFNFLSYIETSYDLDVDYYLTKENLLIKNGSFSKTILKGDNLHQISFLGLTKQDQSYTLTLELNYKGKKRTINYLLNTNNVPLIYLSSKDYFETSEDIIINFSAVDSDNDTLTISINDSRFEKHENSYIMTTNETGNYTVEVSVNDGLLGNSKIADFEVYEITEENNPLVNISFLNYQPEMNVSKNKFFQLETQVCCLNADCGQVNVSLDPERHEYTPSTETHCKDGICTKTLYSGIRFVNEDNKWKKVEEAKSLKGVWDVIINEDPDYPVEIVDFNYNTITLDLMVSENKLNKDIDLKVYNKFNKSKKNKLKNGQVKGIEQNARFSKKGDKIRKVIDFSDLKENPLNVQIKYGLNSTKIQLNEKNTQVLADMFFCPDGGCSTDTRTAHYVLIGTQNNYRELGVWKFNISFIDNTYEILDSKLGIYKYSNYHLNNYTFYAYEFNNYTWSENDETNGVYPKIINNLIDTTESSSGDGWIIFDVGSWVNYNKLNSTVSFFINKTLPDSSDAVYVYSKDSTDPNYRPYLNITYTESNDSSVKGLIGTMIGITPFYTTTENPHTVNLSKDECKNITWNINATGLIDNPYTFFAFANITSNPSKSSITKRINVTIKDSVLDQFSQDLIQGWNLISIPLKLDDPSISGAFSSINDQYSSIWSYENNIWHNQSFNITPENGYWINMKENKTLTSEGTLLDSKTIQLNTGWNLIGYPLTEERNIQEIMSPINNSLQLVYSFENSEWLYYSPNFPNEFNTLQKLKSGFGYLVNVDKNVDLVISSGEPPGTSY